MGRCSRDGKERTVEIVGVLEGTKIDEYHFTGIDSIGYD